MIVHPVRRRLLALVVTAVLAGCAQDAADTPTQTAAETATPKAAGSFETPAAAGPTDGIPLDDLKQLATQALRNQQLHTPAGANAIEYYLALRQRAPKPDAIVESALFDLMPYAVIAAEQALASNDLDTAARLRNLIQRIDRSAPALPRLDGKIAEGQQALQLAQEAALAASAKAAATTAAPAPAALPPSTSPAAATAITAPARPAAEPAKPIAVAQAPATVAPAAAIPAMPAPMRTAPTLVAIRTPEPTFPPEAFRRRKSGSVEIEFQVDLDGRVTDVRVLSANPRIFERNVVFAVRRWQFAPLSEPMTVRRTFNFNAPG